MTGRRRWSNGSAASTRPRPKRKNELGVNIIITDDDWFDYIKLFALFLQRPVTAGC